ncbi:MAG: Crp/Fnr family transcriptional regulator [Pseudomonadota bacterium]
MMIHGQGYPGNPDGDPVAAWLATLDRSVSPFAAEGGRTIKAHDKGDWLFRAGDPASHLFVVMDGAVVLRKVNISGADLAVEFVTRGGALGYRAYVGDGIHALSAQCSTSCVVCRIPVETMAQAGDRLLEGRFIDHMAAELTATRTRMLQVATLKVRDRLLILLARISRDFTTMNDHQTLVLSPPLSRIDMAALAGMTPESLSRCIRGIEEEGLAHFTRRHVVIPSVSAFRAELSRIGIEEGVCAVELALAG